MTETAHIDGKELSLFELNSQIKGILNTAFADAYWVKAEMSDVRTNNMSGHCYLEFIEKSSVTGQIIARNRAAIWAKTFRMLKPYFETETGQLFASGLKVLVKVTVEYHELYGLSLNVIDIDPSYTVGDMLRRRMEIIQQLKEEGVFTLNKELPFPVLPKRIAIITSPTAAGYEDFIKQLIQNKEGYPFYTKLFPAIMQGDKTETSIIAALDQVNRHLQHFDAVVIIRGGGATSELNSFDSYLLAANCAQFPLPIITGIGHERDDTILDMVAHTRMKTPTAVAEFLIGRLDLAAEALHTLGAHLPLMAVNRLEQCRQQILSITNKLPVSSITLLNKHNYLLVDLSNKLQQSLTQRLNNESKSLQLTEQFISMVSPENILKRGYSLTLKDGKIMKHATAFSSGDEMTTRFIDGEVKSTVI